MPFSVVGSPLFSVRVGEAGVVLACPPALPAYRALFVLSFPAASSE